MAKAKAGRENTFVAQQRRKACILSSHSVAGGEVICEKPRACVYGVAWRRAHELFSKWRVWRVVFAQRARLR